MKPSAWRVRSAAISQSWTSMRRRDVWPRPHVRSDRSRLEAGLYIANASGELQSLLGPDFQIEPPSGRGQHFEPCCVFSMMMSISSLFALFIGMFIIYNTFAIAVTERRSEIGVLRALGATRGQIRWLFLGESAVTGIIGSLLGVVVGAFLPAASPRRSAHSSRCYGVAGRRLMMCVDPAMLVVCARHRHCDQPVRPSFRRAMPRGSIRCRPCKRASIRSSRRARAGWRVVAGGRWRVHLGGLSPQRRLAPRLLRRLRLGHRRRAALEPAAVAPAREGDPARSHVPYVRLRVHLRPIASFSHRAERQRVWPH